MSKLFEETAIKGLTISNRFVRSATWEGMANEDGSCTQQLTDYMAQLARGGVGLIISGHAYVHLAGQAGVRQLGVYGDALLAGLREMTKAVHKAGGKIVLQLAHAGCHAGVTLTKQEALGPSVISNEKGPLNREMTIEQIEEVIEAFGLAAKRGFDAGFDGVQIHAAHGYLLSEFLSPFYNKRTDQYGGSSENRARIVLEVLKKVRSQVGEGFPVMIKMNAQDFVEGGLTDSGMLDTASMLEKAGIDAIELSGGTVFSGNKFPIRKGLLESPDEEIYYRDEARKYKQDIKVPLMLVGGIRSFEVAEKVIDEGLADYVSLCRPLIREPDLVNRWKSGDRRKSTCRSDNLCFIPTMKGDGLYCLTEKKQREKEGA